MELVRFTLLVVLFINIALGTLILWKGRRNAVNVAFGALAYSISLWNMSIFMVLSAWGNEKDFLLWGRITFASGTIMSVSFSVFSVVYRFGKPKIKSKQLASLGIAGIVFSALALSPYVVSNVSFSEQNVKAYYGKPAYIWALFELFCWLVIFYNLWEKWRSGSGIEKLRVQYMSLGILVTTTLIAMTSIVAPLALDTVRVAAYGPCWTMVMVSCIAYAIAKHRLMGIRLFIRKSIIYSFMLAMISLIVTLIVIGIPKAFPNLDKTQSTVVSILGLSFIVFTLRPFISDLSGMINDFAQKEQKRYQETLNKFAQSVIRMLDLDEVLKLVFEAMTKALRTNKGSLYYWNESKGRYMLLLSHGFKDGELPTEIPSDNILVAHLKDADMPTIADEFMEAVPDAEFDNIELRFKELNAEILVPIHGQDNKMLGFVSLGRIPSKRTYCKEDIDFLRSISDQASIAIQNALLHQQIVQFEKQASIGRLSAELAHEIKNPLLTIKTCLQLIYEQQGSIDIDKEFLSLALKETDKIDRRVRELLMLARPKEPSFSWCDVNEVLDNTIKMLKNAMLARNIKLVDLRSPEICRVYADREQLDQVFLNLGLNALDAMENGGQLVIETFVKANGSHESQLNDNNRSRTVVVKISDTGEGIPEEEMKNIFEPFYTKKKSGTGLGLSIVRSIIEKHKANIMVSSKEKVGTVFTLEFPTDDA